MNLLFVLPWRLDCLGDHDGQPLGYLEPSVVVVRELGQGFLRLVPILLEYGHKAVHILRLAAQLGREVVEEGSYVAALHASQKRFKLFIITSTRYSLSSAPNLTHLAPPTLLLLNAAPG